MRVYILFFSLILFSCNTKEIVQEIELLSSFDNEYIYFDLNVNSKTKKFLLDTHAGGNVIFKKKGEETELKPIRKIKVNGKVAQVVNIDSLKLGTESFYNIEAVLIEENHSNAFGDVDGIIGLNTLVKKHNWVLDFENKILGISKIKIDEDGFDFVLPYQIELFNRLPMISMKIEGQKRLFMIDTGYGKELGVFSKIKLKGKELEYHKTEWADLYGVKEKLYTRTIIDSVKIGDKYFSNLILECIDDENPKKNLLGIKFFRRFRRVAFDTQNKKIYFKE